MSFYLATLTARKPFDSFFVPGTNPSVVVNRRGARLDAETTKTLRQALKAGRVPDVSTDDVSIEKLDAGPRPAQSKGARDVSTDTSEEVDALREANASLTEANADQADEIKRLEEEISNLNRSMTAELELGKKGAETLAARGAEVERLQGELAESRASVDGLHAHVSGVLDGLTVPQLTDLAKAREVETPSGAVKADLIAALLAKPTE